MISDNMIFENSIFFVHLIRYIQKGNKMVDLAFSVKSIGKKLSLFKKLPFCLSF